MSPIASDDAFNGQVVARGMRISVRDEAIALDWDALERLSAGLAAAIG